jgi:CheY-like chemotaxis protein
MSEMKCAECGNRIRAGEGHYSFFDRAYHPKCYDRLQARQLGPPILVVDGDPTNRQLLVGLLRADGHAVREAKTGEQALRAVSTIAAKLIVINLTLFGMTAVELIRQLRSVLSTLPTPIIVVASADCDEEQTRAALDVGASMCCVEPIASASFSRLVNILLDHAKRDAVLRALPRDWRSQN